MDVRLVLALLVACGACGRLGFEEARTTCACDDNNPCTDDLCADGACLNVANTASCDDGDACTVGDTCVMGVCGAGDATGCAAGPREIFRSVAPGTGQALVSGGGALTLTISGSTAALTSPLPDRVGVGDAIEYDSDGNGSRDAVAFIHGRLSPQVYQVRTSRGATPTATAGATTSFGVFRAYLSLAAAVDRTAGGTRNPNITVPFDGYAGGQNLVAADEQWSFACYDDGTVDAAPVQICSTSYTRGCTTGSWTTDATHVLRIFTPTSPSEVGASQRHDGTWGTGYRRSDGLIMYEGFVRVDGLSLKRATNGIGRSYYVETEGHGGEVWISNSFGWNLITGASKVYDIWDTGVAALGPTYTVFKLWNDIAYNESTTDVRSGFYINSNRAEAYLANCTAYVKGGGAFYQSSNSRATVENCLGVSELNSAFGTDNGFVRVERSAANDATPNNLANGISNFANQTIPFRDAVGRDLHLGATASAPLRGGGLDLSADPETPLTTDIDGQPRPAGAFDIGADQL